MAKFSVILPVRNGGEYVKDCVNSILSQTLQDFNLVVLDNCSTDGTGEWLASLNNDKIIIYPSDRFLTIEENWARITTIPKNEFITLIGHDDILYPDFLANVNKLIQEYPNAGLYHTHFTFIDADGNIKRSSKPMCSFYSFNELLKGFLTQAIDSMGTGYVMRAKDYDEAGGIPVKYPSLLFADFELWLKLAEKGGMAVHPKTSFAFRVHQSTTGNSPDQKLHTGLELYTGFLASVSERNVDAKDVIKEHAAAMLLFYCKGFAHRLLRTPLDKRGGLTVKRWIEETRKMASILKIAGSYFPEKHGSIAMAKTIDSNIVLRKLFLFFKKIYSKPVM